MFTDLSSMSRSTSDSDFFITTCIGSPVVFPVESATVPRSSMVLADSFVTSKPRFFHALSSDFQNSSIT